MYKCNSCKKTTMPREKANKLVVSTRSRDYYEMVPQNDEAGNTFLAQGKKLGEGFETVNEVVLCKRCYDVQSHTSLLS